MIRLLSKFSRSSSFRCSLTINRMMSHSDLVSKIRSFIPELSPQLHKGQCGRIGVVGGSLEYTGAPYFSAISALKVGADLVHVFCCREAAPVIKSYSPELIVHPLLDIPQALDSIAPWLDRLHTLIIGPGLGREKSVLETVSSLIEYCKVHKNIPLVIDADGLFLLSEKKGILNGYNAPIILTPNQMELSRLSQNSDYVQVANELKVILLKKGETDIVYNGLDQSLPTVECKHSGSYRRCGGQGDLLSGSAAIFLAWCHQNIVKQNIDDKFDYSLAAYAASCLTKECSRLAFIKYKRSMTTSDMIQEIGVAFEQLFG